MLLKIFIGLLLVSSGIVEEPKNYNQNSILQWNGAMELIEEIEWKGKVLDVGCGDGKITAWIADRHPGGQVVGLDVAPKMIDFAKKQFSKAEKPNLDFTQGDAANLNYQEEFDIAVSLSALHWVLDQDKALKGIYEALVPGGKTYIFTYAKAPMNLSKVAEELILTEKWTSHFPNYKNERVYYTKEEYEQLLAQAGFSSIEVKYRPSVTRYAGRKAFIAFAKPLLNYIRHLSPELQDQFLEEYTDRMISYAEASEDGSINFEILKLEAIAAKP
jgi:trans-aconitate methyltransferase